jgi:acyl-coenzyme A thioesterase PaaI-like protein
MYQQLSKIARKFMKESTIFKVGFNLSPMYRRSTARIQHVSDDLKLVKIKIPLSYKNRNYVGSIFGGSLFAAVDPIPMIQLMYIFKEHYIIWDKSAQIRFKRPAREDMYALFEFSESELKEILQKVNEQKEVEHLKTTYITDKTGETVFCEVEKTIYIADKEFYKQKKKK